MRRLLDALREDLGLTGTKEGCGEGECGACSVLIDGQVVDSCLVPMCQVAGTSVRTVEGLADPVSGALGPLQQAFLELGGAQCGICTPGMLMAAQAYLEAGGGRQDPDIREAIAATSAGAPAIPRSWSPSPRSLTQAHLDDTNGNSYHRGMKATIGERGQVVIPKPLRDRMGLRPGQQLEFDEDEGRIVVTKAAPADDPIEAVQGPGPAGRLGYRSVVRGDAGAADPLG